MAPKYSPILWWPPPPPTNIHKNLIPQKYSFFWKLQNRKAAGKSKQSPDPRARPSPVPSPVSCPVVSDDFQFKLQIHNLKSLDIIPWCAALKLSRDMWFPTIWHFPCVDSDELVQPLFKLRNSKLCSVSKLFKRLANNLIRLRVYAGWSDPLLVSHTTLLEISCRGSIHFWKWFSAMIPLFLYQNLVSVITRFATNAHELPRMTTNTTTVPLWMIPIPLR